MSATMQSALTVGDAAALGFDRQCLARIGPAADMKADVNVINLGRVAERQPKLVHDFPDDAPRLIQKAVGYKATVCNGTPTLLDDEHTGERAGRVCATRQADFGRWVVVSALANLGC